MIAKPMSRRLRISLIAIGLLGTVCAADWAFPPDMTRANTVSTEVVARDGTLLRAFLSADGYWRLKTTVNDVSPRYLTLLKAYEDKRFDSHPGVDPLALARAVTQLAQSRHIVSGASTLSMQVARLLEPRPRSIGAKLIQMVRAVQLERRYTKDEILSLYLTLAPFGGNLEGVRAASLAYFGKEPKSLSLSEAALLVALPQSPERQRPDRHMLRARNGRDHVLARMVEQHVITAADIISAHHEGVPSLRLALPMRAPHLTQRLAARSKTHHIVSTLDTPLQAAIERLATRETRYMDDGAGIAIVVAENKTREVRAYSGGANYWGTAGKIDLAAAARSPGSALKPLIYGMAFDDLVLHPASLMQDQATQFGDYAPRDFDGGFQGEVTAAAALRMSLNIPAVMVLERVGPLRFTQTLENAGARLSFPTRETRPSLPVALGGLGISLADLTMLYTGIANGGMAEQLRFTKDAPDTSPKRLFGPVAAFYLQKVLTGVSLPDGWAMGQGLSRKRSIGFKTGTSYGYRDAWAVGFSNDYTVGVWVGRADGAPRADHVGRETAAPILLKVFEALPPDQRAPMAPPAGALLVTHADQLPIGLQHFARLKDREQRVVTAIPPPSISFPPNGATVPLPQSHDGGVPLKATGGREPLTWLVNGRLLGSFDRFQPITLTPDGEGVTRITVVDAQGRSDTAQVRFKRLN